MVRGDVVFADADGVAFVSGGDVGAVLSTAGEIRLTERKQAEELRSGRTLFEQLQFASYIEKRESDPTHTFREHLRRIGGAIEE